MQPTIPECIAFFAEYYDVPELFFKHHRRTAEEMYKVRGAIYLINKHIKSGRSNVLTKHFNRCYTAIKRSILSVEKSADYDYLHLETAFLNFIKQKINNQ